MRKIVLLFDNPFNGERSVYSSLLEVRGIGPTLARYICNKYGISGKVGLVPAGIIDKVNSRDFLEGLPPWMHNLPKSYSSNDPEFRIGVELDQEMEKVRGRLKQIKCYRGIRYPYKIRGQKTGSNGRRNKLKVKK